jgi:predicted NUDIX family NTP pyrophosphohydrolase
MSATARRSAGIVLFRRVPGGAVEVLLGHMGGPYWARKDAGAWTIPKGEYHDREEPFAVACREFEEEIGTPVPSSAFTDLGEVRQSGGKVVQAWAAELTAGLDVDPATAVSNTFDLEWPPGSGRIQQFPELDRVAWLDLTTGHELIIPAQRTFLDRLPR